MEYLPKLGNLEKVQSVRGLELTLEGGKLPGCCWENQIVRTVTVAIKKVLVPED